MKISYLIKENKTAVVRTSLFVVLFAMGGFIASHMAGAATYAGRVLNVAKIGGQYSSIQAAANESRPGDTILIAGGTYNEALNPRSGAADKYIAFQARAGERVVLDGDKRARSGNGLMNLDNRSWLKFIGLSFVRSPTHGIYGFRANDIVFQDCEVASSSNGGLVMLGSSDILVDSCNIHNNNDRGISASHEAVTMSEGTTNYEVKNNKVHDNGEEGIDAKYESNGGSIHDNLVYNNRGPNIYADSVSDVKIYNNISYGAQETTKAGISIAVEDYSSTRRVSDIDIFNNVVYGNAGGGISFWIESSGSISDIRIINNTISNNSRYALTIAASSISGTNIVRNNIFSDNSVGGNGAFTMESNFTGDARFVNPGAGDYHLQAGSPAIDAGVAAGVPAFDRDNKLRPQGAQFDMGAYEQ